MTKKTSTSRSARAKKPQPLSVVVRQFREERGLSFRQAQEDSGINKGAIVRVEQGIEPTLRTFAGLMVWMGMSADTAIKEFVPTA